MDPTFVSCANMKMDFFIKTTIFRKHPAQLQRLAKERAITSRLRSKQCQKLKPEKTSNSLCQVESYFNLLVSKQQVLTSNKLRALPVASGSSVNLEEERPQEQLPVGNTKGPWIYNQINSHLDTSQFATPFTQFHNLINTSNEGDKTHHRRQTAMITTSISHQILARIPQLI
ncbi:hypothetical protein DL98DRAFT_528444 [Cadophora sp. DSE1049]|nr:hypothetical protein DL98DRAFT_528444 [Cadophora sp. DSE1049]